MCRQTVTKHTVCGHDEHDTFPCETSIDTGSCPPSEPMVKEETTYCPERTHFADAMKKIETDASLVAVPPEVDDPSAPKRYAKIREHYKHCGHFDKVVQQYFELDEGDPEFITEEMVGSCHGCSAALPWQIEEMKSYGRWTDDLWGAMKNVKTTEEERNIGGDVGWSRQPAPTTESEFTAPGLSSDDASLPRWGRDSDDHDSIDYTPGKNKGVFGRTPPSRGPASSYNSDEEGPETVEGHHDRSLLDEAMHFGDVYANYGHADYEHSDPEHPDHNDMSANRAFTPNDDHPYEATNIEHGDAGPPIPDWQSRGDEAVPGDIVDKPVEVSAEERQNLGIPLTMPLTEARLGSLLRRKNSEANKAMRAHLAGETSLE